MNYDELNTLRQRMIQAGLDDVEEQYFSASAQVLNWNAPSHTVNQLQNIAQTS